MIISACLSNKWNQVQSELYFLMELALKYETKMVTDTLMSSVISYSSFRSLLRNVWSKSFFLSRDRDYVSRFCMKIVIKMYVLCYLCLPDCDRFIDDLIELLEFEPTLSYIAYMFYMRSIASILLTINCKNT